MAGELDDLEPGDDLALAHRAADLDGPAVPHEPVREAVQEADVARELLHAPVVAAAGPLRLLDRVGVALHRRDLAQLRSGAPVVGVRVPQHDAVDAAERLRRGRDRRGHPLLAGVVHHHSPTRLLEQVDVHRPLEATADQPHPIGHGLGRRSGELGEARPGADLQRGHEPAVCP